MEGGRAAIEHIVLSYLLLRQTQLLFFFISSPQKLADIIIADNLCSPEDCENKVKYDTTFSSTSAPDSSSLYLRFPPLSTTEIHDLVFKDTIDIAGVVATSQKLGAATSAKAYSMTRMEFWDWVHPNCP